MSDTRTCPACGYVHTYRSAALADAHHPRHSCACHVRRVAARQRAAQRAAKRAKRDCGHRGAPHGHGTRAAYVKDRCRCRTCTAANTAESTAAKRQKAFGRWMPYVDAAPVRRHIELLREAGIGCEQIAKLVHTSFSHVRELAGASVRSGDSRPVRRIRQDTADRIMAIQPLDANRAQRSRIDAAGTRRRLQALVAIGWPLGELAAELGRTLSNLRRTMRGDRVTVETAQIVAAMYERIWCSAAPQPTLAQRRASNAARDYAHQRGWLAPLAWDDIDTDATPVSARTDPDPDYDEIAIERAIAGDHSVHLTLGEQLEVVRRLSERGQSIRTIADLLSTSKRTVSRYRRRASAA